jgi:hypothetical protein
MDREKIEKALDDGTLAIKVGRNWVPARRGLAATIELADGDWLISVVGGPSRARGFITNIENNRDGRDFAFV